jgi:hypothetical protein
MPLEILIRLINANKSRYIAAPKLKSMEFKRIVAVTGLPGLFEVVSSKNDGALVRSLEDKTTKFVSSRVHNMSHLESIEVYTSRDNVQLTDVFTAMQSSKEKLPDLKDNNSVKKYFEKVYPELDFERVYASDMKKMVKWYSIIDTQKIDFTPEPVEEEEEEVAVAEVKEPKRAKEPKEKEVKETKEPKATKETKEKKETVEAPAKKTAAKKTAAKSEAKKTSVKETEDKPKKAPAKKKKD